MNEFVYLNSLSTFTLSLPKRTTRNSQPATFTLSQPMGTTFTLSLPKGATPNSKHWILNSRKKNYFRAFN